MNRTIPVPVIAAILLAVVGCAGTGSREGGLTWQFWQELNAKEHYRPYPDAHAIVQCDQDGELASVIRAINGIPVKAADGTPASIGPAYYYDSSNERSHNLKGRYRYRAAVLPEGQAVLSVTVDEFRKKDDKLYFTEYKKAFEIRLPVRRDRFHKVHVLSYTLNDSPVAIPVVTQSPTNNDRSSFHWPIVAAAGKVDVLIGLTAYQGKQFAQAVADKKQTPQELEAMRQEYLRKNRDQGG